MHVHCGQSTAFYSIVDVVHAVFTAIIVAVVESYTI